MAIIINNGSGETFKPTAMLNAIGAISRAAAALFIIFESNIVMMSNNVRVAYGVKAPASP